MPVEPLPATYHRTTKEQIDDEPTFTASPEVTIGPVIWQVGTEVLAVEQLDAVATKVEQLLQQDFAGGIFTEGSVPAAGGQAAVKISIVQTGTSPPTSGAIGTWASQTPGMLASFAGLVRAQGYGTTWTPA